jgi:peptide/nickel transport system substrate-binding protein
MEIKDPHLADFAEKSNVVREVCEYLTITLPAGKNGT